MFKFFRWFVERTERQTAQSIVDMARAFYISPTPPADTKDDQAVKRYALQRQSFNDGMKFIDAIRDRYLKEGR